jgi:predicted metalloendopeptidase
MADSSIRVNSELQKARLGVAFQTNRVIAGFTQMLQDLPWMDAQSKLLAIEKANGMIHNIGFPDWILDNKISHHI